jgi:LmbE family N-acetylglucosaminyl deacetylase
MVKRSRHPRLLAAMAHPDDVEIGVGGTLFHLRTLGWELGIVTMTAGDCGSSTQRNEEIARIRQAESKAAAKLLGAWHACVGLIDIEVFANAVNLRRVVEVLREYVRLASPCPCRIIRHVKECPLSRPAPYRPCIMPIP